MQNHPLLLRDPPANNQSSVVGGVQSGRIFSCSVRCLDRLLNLLHRICTIFHAAYSFTICCSDLSRLLASHESRGLSSKGNDTGNSFGVVESLHNIVDAVKRF